MFPLLLVAAALYFVSREDKKADGPTTASPQDVMHSLLLHGVHPADAASIAANTSPPTHKIQRRYVERVDPRVFASMVGPAYEQGEGY